jgi:hypothetical protein
MSVGLLGWLTSKRVGIFMTGLGLKLFLSPERREHEFGVLANSA